MSIRIRRPVISLFSLLLSRGSFTTCLFPISSLLTSLSWVPSAMRSLDRARPSFDWSGHGPRWHFLQPALLHLPPPFLLFLQVVWPSRQSWRNFSTWMLTLTLSLMSYVKWTPMLVVLHDNKLALVVSSLLHLHLQRLKQMRMAMMVMRMRMLALPVMMRWWPLDELPFVIHDKKG